MNKRVQFGSLYAVPSRNGLTKPKKIRGHGTKMVNMGEIFAFDRIKDAPMDRAPLTEKEAVASVLEPGDLLFARQSLVLSGAGKCSVFLGDSEPVTFESHLIRVRLDPGCADSNFYFYYFRSQRGRDAIESIVEQGAGASGIRGSDLQSLMVDWIPIHEQRVIAAFLGTLDEKIELNQRMNETLELLARSIFKDWFVDFGPTRAKTEGRPPYLDPEIWDLFPDAYDDEGKPFGWETKSLDEIASFLNGVALQKYPATDLSDSLPVIKISELRNGISAKSGLASRDVPEKYVVGDGDFLFSWSGSLLAKFWTDGEGALNQHLFKVTSDRYPDWFFSQWVRHHLAEFQAIAASKATTMGHIQRKHLKEAMTTCPPDEVIVALGETVGPIVQLAISNALESRTLAKTRDLLLPKLMSGEIRVDEEKLGEAVA